MALGLTTAGVLATQGAFADDNAQKIAVVKNFLNCNFQGACTGNNANKETKKFLSQSAISVLNYERKNTIKDEECLADTPRCYSGLWTVPGNDLDDAIAKKTLKISVANNGQVVAKFRAFKNSPADTVYFKLVKENGQWKIDNTARAWSDNHTEWWR